MNNFRFLSIILLLLLHFPLMAKAVDDYNVLAFRFENDIFFSDRYYTNGLKLSYTQDGDDFYTSRLQFALLRSIFGDDAQTYQTVSLGQRMSISSDRSIPNPPPDDRPYAGWLYASFGSHLAKENSLDSFTITLGIVGPHSYAADVQKAWHEFIDVQRPMGWSNQIKDEFGFIVSYEHSERVYRNAITDDFSTDLVATIGADLGNVMTQAVVKGIWRFGFNMPYSFSANRVDYADANDVQWRPDSPLANWHCFMYTGGVARFVGYDISLDGNAFRHSNSVASKWLVGEFIAGISTRYKDFQADLNWTLSSAEFHKQKFTPHIFWTATIKVYF